jgi:predicted permease
LNVDLLAIIAPVFLISAAGFIWAKMGRDFHSEFVTTIVLTFATPSLVFASLTSLEVSLAESGDVLVAQLVIVAATGILGAIGLRLFGNLPTHSYLPMLMFGNMGNMGLPLCFFAFGAPGLALAAVAFAVHSVTQFTIGVSVAAGSASIKQLLRTPVIYGVLASLPFMFTGTRPPLWVANTTEVVGNMLIPLMLLTMGVALARLKLSRLGRSVIFAVLRLGGGLLLALAVTEMFGIDGMARGVIIIMGAMPVAVFNYIFAERYKRAPDEVAAAIVISTAISFVTLPALLLIAI